MEDARVFCQGFFRWYNTEHHHSGIGLLIPADLHCGRAASVLATRRATLRAAYEQHPERFVRKPPEPPQVPDAAWINRPKAPVVLAGD